MDWITIFFLNWFINILCMEFLAIRKVEKIIKVDEGRDSKFEAFRRFDLFWFNRPWLYLTCHLSLIKLVVSFGSLFLSGAIGQMLVMFEKDNNYTIKGLRYAVMRFFQGVTAQIAMTGGCTNIWTSYAYPKVCYKKYLGPDWVPDYDRRHCACIVANHSSFFDIGIHTKQQLACFICKFEATQIFGIGKTIYASQCLVLSRDSKNDRQKVQKEVNQRLQETEESDQFDPIVIFAEGGTTNGKYLINFKKGAFVSCRGVLPQTAQFHSYFQSPSSGIIDGLPHYLIGASCPFSTATVTTLPIFKPNDYFFKNHQKEGEEKWETFARVVRMLMSESSGLPMLNVGIEDKFEYKSILNPHKYKKGS